MLNKLKNNRRTKFWYIAFNRSKNRFIGIITVTHKVQIKYFQTVKPKIYHRMIVKTSAHSMSWHRL
jgi:hypothetical protein